MATAVETSSKKTTAPTPVRLVVASTIGAVYVMASLVIVLVAIPSIWIEKVAPSLVGYAGLELLLRLSLQLAAALALAWVGRSIAGSAPPKGIRGGIFLIISAAITIFFIVRAVGLNVDPPAGSIAMAVTGAALLAAAYRLLTSPRGEGWMVSLEDQGWFQGTPYKKALGHRVRRLTIAGLLIVGGSGIWVLWSKSMIPANWELAMPGLDKPVLVLAEAQYAVPVLLLALTLWVAYRLVNVPAFAEFLIATEAEMNKVSWSTRKGLYQDTVVVLITTIGMTLFLFAVDVFWGWLLSRETIGVLPAKATEVQKGPTQEAKW